MPTLIDIPAELLEEILSSLSVSDYSTLSRTCKILHTFFSPRIYHTVNWSWEDDQPSPPYHLLLRTLLGNARLASYVKVLKSRGGGIVRREEWETGDCDYDSNSGWRPIESARSIWLDGRRAKSSFKSTDVHRVINLISSIASSSAHKREWILEFDRGNVDVIMALILHQIQDIERLDLGFGFMQRSKFIPRVFRHLIDAQKSIAVFPHLISVDLGVDGPHTPSGIWSDLDQSRLFFYLPKITFFNTIFLEPSVFAWPSPSITPRSESLLSLTLRKCTASEDTLEKILSCTPQLRHLVYDHYRMVACGIPHWESYKELCWTGTVRPKVLVHGPRLSKALAHVQSTLESLVLKVRFKSKGYYDIKDLGNTDYFCCLVGRVTGFDKMPNLTSLEISWALLLGWDPDFEEVQASYRLDFDSQDPFTLDPGVDHFPWPAILPSTIQTLRLRDDLSDFSHYPYRKIDPINLLEHLLYARKSSLRALARVEFLFIWNQWYGREGWPKVLMKKLLDTCKRDGIKCRILQEELVRKLSELVDVIVFDVIHSS
ncbi:uncharacterized protein K460DRAFT_400007 [Cucurbitaria berberidis CBS 394.84]|uniref:F-box domain-containing protein n=1 Tax=Cucurbitaria berberidis CBS 394.84 TaxID=1168544 RepID=A0A9P4LD08_9PLEO|nr:uncharacterized protein K460DRAFT_400007 [Cucurbitaria berberidis CBS 394.84]KAF1849907.1 hypothetical protein K460DRAFT_400007 [Cucurbitaria berberidis CBS 394.84]